ncbi:MAG: aldo/keto reductase [Candidatus Aminicenantes bacterium]|nr:MAG: aldo/keto reductase [Candidatus Aminicenantes bacterium]
MPKKRARISRLSRRRFIHSSLSAAAGLGIAGKNKLFGGTSQEAAEEKSRIREYRILGRTGFKASDIGFGAGNLTDPALFAAALDAGVNYIDTAEHYARGNSERTIGQVIKDRDRKKLFIAGKLNFSIGKSTKEGLKERAHKCLERLQTDYLDCLMIHMTPTLDQVTHEGYHEAIKELRAEGRVKYTGLSNHGIEYRWAGFIKDPMEKVILAAAEDGRFDVVLFTYNFIQKEQGDRILKACREKNMGTTLMKTDPVRSYNDIESMYARMRELGRVTEAADKIINEFKAYADKTREFAKKYGMSGDKQVRGAAIKFCLSNPDIHSVCPTINTHEDLEFYLSLSGGKLEPVEEEMLADYKSHTGSLYCRHACGECESHCPHDVPVNSIMRYQHYFMSHGREKHAMEKYAALQRTKAEGCIDCEGFCEKACPYGVKVQGLLMAAHQTLSLDSA